MKLIWQLLRQHVSVLQLAGFLVTNLVGVAIVLTAVQLYRDVTPALQAPDSFLDNDFIILTKEVEGAGIGKTSFTQAELAELVGVRRETIVNLEKGKYNPSLKLAMDIAKVFHTTVEELFAYTED